MSDLFTAYCELISSPAQLARCQEATSVSELLSVVKHLWQQTALSDDQLIAELAHLNQQVISGTNSFVEPIHHNLQQLINLQASVFPARPDVVIKWNAWDIFRWELIRAIYLRVPVIFLVRNPVEILASHQRLAGRHMSGDSVLSAYQPEMAPQRKTVIGNRHIIVSIK